MTAVGKPKYSIRLWPVPARRVRAPNATATLRMDDQYDSTIALAELPTSQRRIDALQALRVDAMIFINQLSSDSTDPQCGTSQHFDNHTETHAKVTARSHINDILPGFDGDYHAQQNTLVTAYCRRTEGQTWRHPEWRTGRI